MNGPAFEGGLASLLATNSNDLHLPPPSARSPGAFRFVNGRLHLSIPSFGSIEGKWEPEERERQAAWELYVEIISCVSLSERAAEGQMLGETLVSLQSLVDAMSGILRKYGPEIARSNARSTVSFATVAIVAMNHVLAPAIAKARWPDGEELKVTLERTRQAMIECTDVLAQVAKIPAFHRGSIALDGKPTNGHG